MLKKRKGAFKAKKMSPNVILRYFGFENNVGDF